VIYGIARRRSSRDHGWSALVNSLRFGQEAPGFSLPSTAGNQTALADFKGKTDVVLVFYCYDWGSI
jgi:peroxiredoxin